MKFIHSSRQLGETIAAVATPPGEGGVAIVRISGDRALEIADKVFSGPVSDYASHTAHFGSIYNDADEHVDDVLLLPMLGTRSYTGETTVEIHCHGGSLITRRVLETVLKAGARPALPGEFTLRAFLNGKMDLAQAEAVQTLIGAKNERALDAAENQLKGNLSRSIGEFRKSLTSIAAILEAWVDFPEEGLEFASPEELIAELSLVRLNMEKLAATFRDGKRLHEGPTLCLVGCPNVGKSSLMNALLDKDRSIISAVPGTTRDILEDHLTLNGLHFKISDTAGIRETDEEIELEGIRRSKLTAEESDIVLLVLDAQKGLSKEDESLFSAFPERKTIVVWNKIDLCASLPLPPKNLPAVYLSAKKRTGLSDLLEAIDRLVWENGPPSKDEVLITQVRHKEALVAATAAICRVLDGLHANLSPEFLTQDIREALSETGKITGADVTEEILSEIFSKFCIGK